MKLSIHGHNMEVNTRLRDYVEKKTGRLDRYMPTLTNATIDLTEQNARNIDERQVAQVTVRDRHGLILRAEERSSDIYASIDAVVDKLYRQISRYQGKMRRRNRRGGRVDTAELLEAEPLPIDVAEEEEQTAQIVRHKRFSARPMTAEEASDQMELLGHDFFVFFNGDEEQINVIYKRRDGNFGLLQPDMS